MLGEQPAEMLAELPFWVLRLYLDTFAYLAPDDEYVRSEHALIEYSIRERVQELRLVGRPQGRAVALAYWEHLGEIAPWVLALKTADHTRIARRRALPVRRRSFVTRLVLAGGVAVLAAIALVNAILPPTTHATGVVGVGAPGEVRVMGEFGTLREALFRSHGICLDESVEPADLTDELLRNGSPGATCDDLRPDGGGLVPLSD